MHLLSILFCIHIVISFITPSHCIAGTNQIAAENKTQKKLLVKKVDGAKAKPNVIKYKKSNIKNSVKVKPKAEQINLKAHKNLAKVSKKVLPPVSTKPKHQPDIGVYTPQPIHNNKLIKFKSRRAVSPEVMSKISLSESFLLDNKPDVHKIMRFVQKNPKWITNAALLKHIEHNLNEDIPLKLIHNWLSAYPPSTKNGLKYFALSILAYNKTLSPQDVNILRKAWVTCKFNNATELLNFTHRLSAIASIQKMQHPRSKMKKRHISFVDESMLQERIAHLISDTYTKKTSQEKNRDIASNLMMLKIIAKSINLNYDQKLDLINQMRQMPKENIKLFYNNLPKHLKSDPNIAFLGFRAMYKNIKQDSFITEEEINNLVTTYKIPILRDGWWEVINCYARDFLLKKDYNSSLKIVSGMQLDAQDCHFTRSHYLFLKGFVQYKLGKMTDALKSFDEGRKVARNLRYVAKFNYWSGHILSILKSYRESEARFKEAANLPYTFYGQMALKKLGLTLTANQLLSHFRHIDEQEDAFGGTISAPTVINNITSGKNTNNSYLLNIVTKHQENLEILDYIFNHAKDYKLSKKLLISMIDASQNIVEKLELYHLISEYQDHHINTSLGSTLMTKNNVFLQSAYPLPYTTLKSHIMHEALHAIIRQESEFRYDVIAFDGGLGLMQLMDYTGKRIAEKMGLRFSKQHAVTIPAYNINIGGYYLNYITQIFNSNLLGFYSYNAGEHRVSQWLEQIGPIHNDSDIDILEWMEQVPFNITREYGQKVMANAIIYQILLKGKIDFKTLNLHKLNVYETLDPTL